MDNVVYSHQDELITPERAEKLDLLSQLILNQKETIILCGCVGIGKTTLLHVLKKTREDIWVICLLQGSSTLTLNQILSQIGLAIRQRNPELESYDLLNLLSFCEWQQQKVVLIVDDAFHLSAGLINALSEYSLQNPIVRIVLVFTREQLSLKNITDRAVEDCYFVEIPALAKSQIAIFLQNSSVCTDLNIDLKKLDNRVINKLYQHTSGVPGKIIAALPLLIESHPKTAIIFLSPSRLKVGLISCIFLLSAILFQYYNNELLKSFKPVVTQKIQLTKSSYTSPNTTSQNTSAPIESKKTVTISVENSGIQQDADANWLTQQTPEKYTLQLMALSKRQSLVNIVKKYPKLQSELKILSIKGQKQEKYVLVYSSFSDEKAANNAAKLLPAEFKHAWFRQFSALQKDVKNQ